MRCSLIGAFARSNEDLASKRYAVMKLQKIVAMLTTKQSKKDLAKNSSVFNPPFFVRQMKDSERRKNHRKSMED